MAVKISKTNGTLSLGLICTLSIGIVTTAHYISFTNTTPDNAPNFLPIISSASIVEAAEINSTDPLIGALFKSTLPVLTPNMNMPAIPTPPGIPNMPNISNIPGISGPHVSGIIMPNVAILNISGKSIVVKLGDESMLGVVETITRKGVTIDGKFYTYKRN